MSADAIALLLRSSHRPAGQRRVERDLFLFGMERRLLQDRDLIEECVDEPCKPAVTLGIGRPIVGGQHRRCRDRVDPFAFRDQIRGNRPR